MNKLRFTETDLQNKHIVPPPGGWTEHTKYPVEVSIHPGNMISHGILSVGTLNVHGNPNGKNSFVDCSDGEDERGHWDSSIYPFSMVHYLKVLDT